MFDAIVSQCSKICISSVIVKNLNINLCMYQYRSFLNKSRKKHGIVIKQIGEFMLNVIGGFSKCKGCLPKNDGAIISTIGQHCSA